MKKSRVALTILFLAIMAAIIANPARYIKSASDGLLVFSLNVLPSLFPFLFLTKILTELGTLNRMSAGLGKLTKRLYRAPACSGYIFLMSVLSGYPVGAKLVSEFAERGQATRAEAGRMAAFCSTSGPLFVLGTVGASMLFSVKAGAVIFLAHVLSALINGLIYRGYRKSDPPGPETFPALQNNPNLLYDSIYGSVTSILIVGGYITLFYVAIDILHDYNVLYPLEWLLGKLLSVFGLPAHAGTALASGMVEATRGCLDLSRMGLSLRSASVLCCAALSFGGLSILMQSVTFLSRAGVPTGLFLLSKLTHAVLAAALCLGLSYVIPL